MIRELLAVGCGEAAASSGYLLCGGIMAGQTLLGFPCGYVHGHLPRVRC